MNSEETPPAPTPPSPSPPPATNSAQIIVGALMLGCGILAAGLSGLCTLVVAGSALMDAATQGASDSAGMIPAVLIFGGIPVAIGVGMVFLGRYLIRTGKEQ